MYRILLPITLLAFFITSTQLTSDPFHDSLPKWSPVDNRIAFLRILGGTLSFFHLNTDEQGGGSIQVTDHRNVSDTYWSPDSKRVAYLVDNTTIRVMDADGSNGRDLLDVLPDNPVNGGLEWSPDGKQLLYSSFDKLIIVDVATATLRQLPFTSIIYLPKWSPDGTEIAFVHSTDNSIYIINIVDSNGGNLRQVIHRDHFAYFNWSPNGDQFIFAYVPNAALEYTYEIAVINVDGTDFTRLTNNHANEAEPSFSPDGNQILFTRNDDIYTMQADGGDEIRHTITTELEYASRWSLDGESFAFQRRFANGSMEIVEIEANGGTPVRLATVPESYGRASLSPDFLQVIYAQQEPYSNELFMMDDDGGAATPLLSGLNVLDFQWSPDGQKLAVNVQPDQDPALRELYVINADGSNPIIIETDPIIYNIAWSPDSQQFVVTTQSVPGSTVDFQLVKADGSTMSKVATIPFTLDFAPVWSSDGSKLAYADSDIFVVDLESGITTNLTQQGGINRSPTWSPDGKSLAYLSPNGLERIPATGGASILLYNSAGTLYYPDWSPDGSKIALLIAHRCCQPIGATMSEPQCCQSELIWQLIVLNADGSDFYEVSTSPLPYSPTAFKWSPDSSHILLDSYPLEVIRTSDGEQGIFHISDGLSGTGTWSPDGRRFVVGNGDLYISQLD